MCFFALELFCKNWCAPNSYSYLDDCTSLASEVRTNLLTRRRRVPSISKIGRGGTSFLPNLCVSSRKWVKRKWDVDIFRGGIIRDMFLLFFPFLLIRGGIVLNFIWTLLQIILLWFDPSCFFTHHFPYCSCRPVLVPHPIALKCNRTSNDFCERLISMFGNWTDTRFP